jgi:Tol biopolymer transport system component
VSENDAALPDPITIFGDYVRVVDLHWLPDGSGFMVARTTSLLDENVNLYEFLFATGELRRITSFSGSFARRFSISPDGQRIVLERVTSLDGPSDLWVVGRDGTGERLLVRGGEAPAWNPTKP